MDKTQMSVVRLTVNELACVEVSRKFFRLEAPEREERKALLEITGGSGARLRGNP